jgi:hypothetical protein
MSPVKRSGASCHSDTARYVIEVEEPGDIAAFVPKEKPFFIMIRDRREQMEKELLTGNKLYTRVKQEMGTDRTLVLLSNKPHKALTLKDPFRRKPAG